MLQSSSSYRSAGTISTGDSTITTALAYDFCSAGSVLNASRMFAAIDTPLLTTYGMKSTAPSAEIVDTDKVVRATRITRRLFVSCIICYSQFPLLSLGMLRSPNFTPGNTPLAWASSFISEI